MNIERKDIYERAVGLLHSVYGESAEFREGQYEAIESTLTKKRTLVVQRTGWGKSLVYFISARLVREDTGGVALVVSPLLSLMDNQMAAARAMGLRCEMLNGLTRDRREEILSKMEMGEVDLVLVTPETLFADGVYERITRKIKVGLFVVDEAHCISDWGHDFRLEYSHLSRVVQGLPPSVPVLATTATANDRVVSDLERQLGSGVYVSRGPLARESLYIQVLHMSDKVSRYAWIVENVRGLEGSGIIYCLTRADCEHLADFLRQNGINAEAYYSRMGKEEENQDALRRFHNDEIKVLVATVKLGMGYDKGNIAFIIHYQSPANIVSYYQQIGRAGRNIPRANIFLMSGKEDEDIVNHFIDTAFPTKEECEGVIYLLERDGDLTLYQLFGRLNVRHDRVRKAVEFLLQGGYIEKRGRYYTLTDSPFVYNGEYYDAITEVRRSEWREMRELARHKGCYLKFIVSSLDDGGAQDCGHCAFCSGEEFREEVSLDSLRSAGEYINASILTIEPRKKWSLYRYDGDIGARMIESAALVGIALSRLGDPGYGRMVKDALDGGFNFPAVLIGRACELLRDVVKEEGITHLCALPPIEGDRIEVFAKELAKALGIEYFTPLKRVGSISQTQMENGMLKCANAYESFVLSGEVVPRNVLLIDDVVDSRWTLTMAMHLLTLGGAERILPFALAAMSRGETREE